MVRFTIALVTTAALMFAAGNAVAQTRDDDPRRTGGTTKAPAPRDNAGPWQFWVKGQGQSYSNFFQRPAGQPQDDVQALLGELGASVRVSTAPLRAYGSVNYLHFSDNRLENSPGARVGLRLDGNPHAFDVYAEQLRRRPSFEIGDTFDQADIRNLVGDYSYRFARDWQVSLDGQLQHQNVHVTNSRDNDYRGAGAALRWRGSRVFSPEIGFRNGTRDVVDNALDYDEREAYVQVRSQPVPPLYLSLRFRNRTRDYTTSRVTASEFGREDKRHQITANASWAMSPALSLDFYGSREKASINRPGRNFKDSLLILGATWRF